MPHPRTTPFRLIRLLAAWLLRCGCAAALVLAGGPALAVVAVTGAGPVTIPAAAVRVLADAEGKLGVGDIARLDAAGRLQAAGAPGGELNLGYSGSAWWLALDLGTAPQAATDWLLEVGYPSIDHIELFTPDAQGGWKRTLTGDLERFTARPFAHRNLVLPLTLEPGRTRTAYLRVQSAGTLTLPLTLWTRATLHAQDQRSYALLSLYYGLLLGLLAYNLLLWLSTRDVLFLDYVAFAAAMAVGQASLNGLGNQFLWPDWPAWGNAALPIGNAATGLFGALFTRRFLNTARDFPRLDRAIVFMAGAFTASILAVPVHYQAGALLTSFSGLVFALLAAASGWYCLAKGHPGARWFVLAWSLLLAGVAILALRNLGWVPTNGFTTYAMQAGSALEMLLLSFALADRITVLRREREAAGAEALAAKQALVESLTRSEQELEQRVQERTRDLEQANRDLRHKEEQLQYMVQHDPLTGLANRTLLEDRLGQALMRARRSGRAVSVLVGDLDGFKRINDEHGHDVGDQVIKAVAMRLRACVRESDTVARLGGDEFVIVLEDLQELADTAGVADKLVEVSAWPVHVAPQPLRISISIGVACFPRDATDLAGLLKRADDTMYQAKGAGRNRWVAVSKF